MNRLILSMLLAVSFWSSRAQTTPAMTGIYDREVDRFVLSINLPGSALQASTDLATWVVLSEAPGSQFSDAESTTLPWRYYRLNPGDASGTVVGYIKIDLSFGYSFLSDPFVSAEPEWGAFLYKAFDVDRTREINGTIMFHWNASSQSFRNYLHDFGEFGPPPPAKTSGDFVLLTMPRTIIFSGELPPESLQHDYPAGLFLLGSVLTPNSVEDLFPNAREGSMIFVWNEATQQFQTSLYDFGQWSPPLTIMPGRSCWLSLREPANWIQPIPASR